MGFCGKNGENATQNNEANGVRKFFLSNPIFRDCILGIVILLLLGILLAAIVLIPQLNRSPSLPNEAIETLNLYVYHGYSEQIKVVHEQLVYKEAATETWCVTTEPANGNIYWKLVRFGEFRWDVYPSNEMEFKKLSCLKGGKS
jgi:hypothetical protein